jgi:hypothetical protein
MSGPNARPDNEPNQSAALQPDAGAQQPLTAAELVRQISDVFAPELPPEVVFLPGPDGQGVGVDAMKSGVKPHPTSPVGDPENIDVLNKRPDGIVDLLILVTRPLEAARQTIATVSEKFRNYCLYVKCPAFAAEFGPPESIHVRVGLLSDWDVPELVIQALEEIADDEQLPAEFAIFYEYPA